MIHKNILLTGKNTVYLLYESERKESAMIPSSGQEQPDNFLAELKTPISLTINAFTKNF